MKFGLIGHPIAHSMSPSLFRAGYEGRFPYELIEGSDFEASYRRFLKDYDGINVTAPFKELAYAKADLLSEECRIIKATNLLVKTPEGVKAYNSDYMGVSLWLKEIAEGQKTRPKTLIVGLGGAGKAAAVAAASLGMDLILMNRDRNKSAAVYESIAQMQDAPYAEVRELGEFRKSFREADIIIYNIPTAIPDLKELTAEDFGSDKSKFILEANYKDPSFDNSLIEKMKQANPLAQYTSGRTWLLYQALTGYEIFTGEKPDLGPMAAVM